MEHVGPWSSHASSVPRSIWTNTWTRTRRGATFRDRDARRAASTSTTPRWRSSSVAWRTSYGRVGRRRGTSTSTASNPNSGHSDGRRYGCGSLSCTANAPSYSPRTWSVRPRTWDRPTVRSPGSERRGDTQFGSASARLRTVGGGPRFLWNRGPSHNPAHHDGIPKDGCQGGRGKEISSGSRIQRQT